MAIVIEKGVPLPATGTGRPSIYPWRKMDIGDSFFIPGTTTKKFAGQAGRAAIRTGRRFSTRTVDGGVRVWRIA